MDQHALKVVLQENGTIQMVMYVLNAMPSVHCVKDQLIFAKNASHLALMRLTYTSMHAICCALLAHILIQQTTTAMTVFKGVYYVLDLQPTVQNVNRNHHSNHFSFLQIILA